MVPFSSENLEGRYAMHWNRFVFFCKLNWASLCFDSFTGMTCLLEVSSFMNGVCHPNVSYKEFLALVLTWNADRWVWMGLLSIYLFILRIDKGGNIFTREIHFTEGIQDLFWKKNIPSVARDVIFSKPVKNPQGKVNFPSKKITS